MPLGTVCPHVPLEALHSLSLRQVRARLCTHACLLKGLSRPDACVFSGENLLLGLLFGAFSLISVICIQKVSVCSSELTGLHSWDTTQIKSFDRHHFPWVSTASLASALCHSPLAAVAGLCSVSAAWRGTADLTGQLRVLQRCAYYSCSGCSWAFAFPCAFGTSPSVSRGKVCLGFRLELYCV